MEQRKKKISQLPASETLAGLWTIGVDALNRSVKISLEWLRNVAEGVQTAITNATNAARDANSAATLANQSASLANNKAALAEQKANLADSKATAANTAAGAANDAADLANRKAGDAEREAARAGQEADNLSQLKSDTNAAKNAANEKAQLADEKARLADEKAEAAATAAGNASAAAERADGIMNDIMNVVHTLVDEFAPYPQGLTVEYPSYVTLGNLEARIDAQVSPVILKNNILFLPDDKMEVRPDGAIAPLKLGMSRVYIIPTDNTSLYQAVNIEVVAPGARLTETPARILSSGGIRLT